jgi:hypothetical protein
MSSRELTEGPRGRGTALCHGPGESPITSGEGRGVRSLSAINDGEDMAEEGDSDPARLLLDRAVLRYFSSIMIGAVADWRSPSLPVSATVVVLIGVLRAVGVVEGGRSVTRVRPLLGARTCQRGTYRGSVALAGACCELKDGRLAFDSDEEAFRCADDPAVASVPVLSALLNSPRGAVGWGPVAGSRLPWDDSGPSMVIV